MAKQLEIPFKELKDSETFTCEVHGRLTFRPCVQCAAEAYRAELAFRQERDRQRAERDRTGSTETSADGVGR